MPQDAGTQDNGRLALFIDLDGLLREFAEAPQIPLPATVKVMLQSLCTRLDGALALLSARRIAEVDALLAPYRFCCAGAHGWETRDAAGHMWTQPIAPRAFDSVHAIHPAAATLATAIASFMEQAPFRGRTPVCIGDDQTDEDAFALVNAARGFAVKIGTSSPGTEPHRMTAMVDAIRWLEDVPPILPPQGSCNRG